MSVNNVNSRRRTPPLARTTSSHRSGTMLQEIVETPSSLWYSVETSSPRSETMTSAISEVAAGTPSSLSYSLGTKFGNFSSFGTWTVKGLTALTKNTTSLKSIPFSHQNRSEWCMILTNQSNGLHLSFFLKKCETQNTLQSCVKVLEILPTGEKREALPWTWLSLSSGGKSEPKLIRKLDTSKSEDEIILECEISIQCITQNRFCVAESVKPNVGLMKSLCEMFDNEVLTDFDIHADQTVMKAHRALLSVRSPYFAAMLLPHTKEAKEGCVEVSDVKPVVLKQVLLYMYTGVAPALEDMSWELLIAADKYQLHELKGQCETHIAGCLNVDNAAETAANAKVFSCDVLWNRAVLYIQQNLCKVMRTDGWNDIITTHPEAVQCISKLME